ncbi:LPXTG cell wall anchor domain-containing protein [Collinsella vaginalis]|uniref:LPXTG cell wall anchor domain-containing protein n=1 Tax=Collinsella vaginalis TaxID=1870987 RepID=UPI00117D39AB
MDDQGSGEKTAPRASKRSARTTLPQTGDYILAGVGILAGIGVVAVVVAVVLKRRK